MNYLTYGDKRKKSIVLIHGMATTASLCYERILPFLDYYYVVLVQVDGHIEGKTTSLESIDDACTDIERYISTELGGHVFCLSGFSMGGTMAVEIAGRNNVIIDKLFIDAAFLTELSAANKRLYKKIFWSSIKMLQLGIDLPDFLLDAVMGEGNRAVIGMLYRGVSKRTIYNACDYIYTYAISDGIRNYKGDAMFVYGQNEPYPRRSAKLLKSYLPSLQVEELYNMGHGECLYNQPEKYTNMLLDFLEGDTMATASSNSEQATSNDVSLQNAQNNQAKNDRLIKLTCEQCGAPLDIDTDDLIAFCPHCGAKLLIDMADMQKVMIEKEQTKRQEKRHEHELEMQKIESENNKDFWKKSIIMTVIFFAVFIILVLIGTSTLN